MTQQVTAAPEPYSQEEVEAASSAEQASLAASQNNYLTNRVVTLRAELNRLKSENDALREELHQHMVDGVKEDAAAED